MGNMEPLPKNPRKTSCPSVTETFTMLLASVWTPGLEIVVAFVMLATP